jgi:hypothetical protein
MTFALTTDRNTVQSPRCFRWGCLLIIGVSLRAGQLFAVDAMEAPHSPLVVVTAASVDRLRDRVLLLSEIGDATSTKEELTEWMSSISGRSIEGLDCSKPVGVMLFFSQISRLSPVDQSDDRGSGNSGLMTNPELDHRLLEMEVEFDEQTTTEKTPQDVAAQDDDPLWNLEVLAASIIQKAVSQVELRKEVYFAATTNFEALIASLKLIPVFSRPGEYTDSRQSAVHVRRVGDFVLLGADADLVAGCPDPRSMIRPLLGTRDVVVSFQTKGLPGGLRMLGAEAIKAAFAAALQQRDDEPASVYALRRTWGNYVAEILDVAVLHIDELTLGVRLDPEHRQFVLELDVVGAEDGKLARFVQESTPNRSPFGGLPGDKQQLSLGLSLAIPERHARPLAHALRDYTTAIADETETGRVVAPLFEVASKLVESRSIDLIVLGEETAGGGSIVLGIKVPGGSRFPEQFQRLFDWGAALPWSIDHSWEIATDIVAGVHAYRVSGSLIEECLGSWIQVQDGANTRITFVATPDAIWITTSHGTAQVAVPDLLKRAIEETAPETATPAMNRVPFRMKLRSAMWKTGVTTAPDPDPAREVEVRQARLRAVERKQKEQKLAQAMSSERPDGIHIEVRPTARGAKLAVQWDEAFVAYCGRLLDQSIGVRKSRSN